MPATDERDRTYWQRVDEIFHAVLETAPPHDRAARLDALCGSDPALYAEVARLLSSDSRVEAGFLEPRAAVPLDSPPKVASAAVEGCALQEGLGAIIGPYTLHEKLGEGGFGVVYLAEQHRPIRRQVALKIIKPGMDTRQVVARFQAERQALALMDHPNIARVLDGGETESGRPYFVMEQVKGVPITNYCDQCSLTTRERLELFMPVCQAVQHAHLKGIIHRDVKPSNVMVATQDGRPAPKVIDFGVAKALNQRLTEDTLHTQFAQMVGTPLYMSPEQAEMSPLEVDTRSDIYSLGALLYELLTGMTPFESERLKSASFDELRRMIREEEPPTPSSRLSTLGDRAAEVAQQRGTEPRKLRQFVRGDLDWIVMKALEKDRTRRYQTAAALAGDLERFIRNDPVEARPPSAFYKVIKFTRRHVALSAGLAIAVAGVLLGGLAAAWQAHTVTVQRDRAEKALSESQTVTEFVRSILVQADPKTYGQDHSIRDALERAGPRIEVEFADAPRIRAAIHESVAEAYWGIGELATAKEHFRLALASHQAADPADERARHVTAIQLVRLLLYTGDVAEADSFLAELERAHTTAPLQDPSVIADISALQAERARMQREYARAIKLFQKAREFRERVPGDQRVNLAAYSMELAQTASIAGRDRDGPVELARDAVSVFREVLGTESALTVWGMRDLAHFLAARGLAEDLVEAEGLLRESLLEQSRISGESSLEVAIMTSELGSVLAGQGRLEEARTSLYRALELKRALLGDDHLEVAQTAFNLGKFLMQSGSPAEAIPLLQDSARIRRGRLAPMHPDVALSLRLLGHVMHALGDDPAAEKIYRESLASSRQLLGASHPDLAAVLADVAATLIGQDKYEDAEDMLREAFAMCETTLGDPPLSWVRHDVMSLLGAALTQRAEGLAEADAPGAMELFFEAERLLLDSYKAMHDNLGLPERARGLGTDSREDALHRIVRLYEAWNAVQPGSGFDAEAAEWRAQMTHVPAGSARTE